MPISHAKTIIFRLKMTIQCEVRNVVVECDNLQVINLLNGRKSDGSCLGMIVCEIQAI